MVKSYRPGGVAMIAALPGTYLVSVYFDDKQIELVKLNVIGWQVSSERILTPLIADPRSLKDEDWYIAHPDGRVECSDGRCWNDVDSWVLDQHGDYKAGLA